MNSIKIVTLKFIWPFVYKWRKYFIKFKVKGYERKLVKDFYFQNINSDFENGLFVNLDSNFSHGGFVDRVKGIISGYYLASISNLDFYIYLEDINDPIVSIINDSVINILYDKSKVCYNKKKAYPVVWYNYTPKSIKKILKRIEPEKQLHLYCNIDIIPVFTKNHENSIIQWSSIFNFIFKFEIKKEFSFNSLSNNYIGVHFRFMGILGDFKDIRSITIDSSYKDQCISWCSEKLLSLIHSYDKSKFIIVSDSNEFLNHIFSLSCINDRSNDIFLDVNNIGHTALDKSKNIFDKVVFDFLSLSNCKKIFQIRYGKMHKSDFSRCASYVNFSEFEIIESN